MGRWRYARKAGEGLEMKLKRLSGLAAFAFFAAIQSALAVTLPLVDEGSITYDPNTGLRWLDVTQSTNRSFNDVSSQFGRGGDFYGYRYATAAEVGTLFMNAGLPITEGPQSQGTVGVEAQGLALIN